MTESVVRLFSKADRDPRHISSWRPVTLFNCDMELYSLLVYRRLQGYLKVVVHPDYGGCMRGRHISKHLIVMRALASPDTGAVLHTVDAAAYD